MSAAQDYTYSVYTGSDVTDEQIATCSELFNANYGVWGPQAIRHSRFLKQGSRVRLLPKKLREKLGLENIGNVLLCTCCLGESLVAHAFASTWDYGHGSILWITQLVVSLDHRKKGIATTMLRRLRSARLSMQCVGIASSHPGACMALSRSVGMSMKEVDLSFTMAHAREILLSTLVEYLQDSLLRGNLFDAADTSGAISSVDTQFFVDHDEPSQAQEEFKARHGAAWPLGKLLEGHEFIVILKV